MPGQPAAGIREPRQRADREAVIAADDQQERPGRLAPRPQHARVRVAVHLHDVGQVVDVLGQRRGETGLVHARDVAEVFHFVA